VLPTSNRWGKTTVIPTRHYHKCIYKAGAEQRFLDDDGATDLARFLSTKYETVHTAGEWEQAALGWHEALKLHGQNEPLRAFVKGNPPRTLPPHIDFINGAKWMFRTLGPNASGVDGKSIYYLSIDEAGWLEKLLEMMNNVLRIRVADVQGIIDIVGTMKPGVSRDFYKIAVRAAAYTGETVVFGHAGVVEDEDDVRPAGSMDETVKKYLADFGIDITEYRDALGLNE
jgi:hypothetical protein